MRDLRRPQGPNGAAKYLKKVRDCFNENVGEKTRYTHLVGLLSELESISVANGVGARDI